MEKYRQVKMLGKGSYGSAWLVERIEDKVWFVAKEIRLQVLKPLERESAMNEVEVLRTLDHPNITRYIDHYEHRGSMFIVMEYADAGDLYTRIKNRNGVLFSEKKVLHYFCQICLALAYLHDRHVLHRDLKTQNVFLTSEGIVKLGDFGISTVLRNTYELKRTVCGTPYYFSPELCLNKPYNNKSDVWALGCVLYETATLNHAFDGKNMKSLVQKILKGVYPPLNPLYSPELSHLVASMLQIDPQRRPNVSQIIGLPVIHRALHTLQMELQQAEDAHALEAPPQEVPKERRAVAKSSPEVNKPVEEARGEQETEELRRQRRQQLAKQQQALEFAQAEQLHQRKLLLKAKLRERQQQPESSSKPDAATIRQREEAWARSMRQQQAESNRRLKAEAHKISRQSASSDKKPSNPNGLYKEMRQQAELNRMRVLADLGRELPPDVKPAPQVMQLPPPKLPPAPSHYTSRRLSQVELEKARHQAFWQMRHEAEKNRRKMLGMAAVSPTQIAVPLSVQQPISSSPSPPNQPPHASASAAAGDSPAPGAEARGAEVHESSAAVGPVWLGEREVDRKALRTIIGAALDESGKRSADFDDDAFRDDDPGTFIMDGETIQLPNVSTADPLMHRIESLRLHLEQQMGYDAFCSCYRAMNNISADDNEAMQNIADALPKDKQRFIPVVAQLIVCEDAFNHQSMVPKKCK